MGRYIIPDRESAMTMVTLLTGMAQARARTSARNTPAQNTADRSSYAMLQLCRSNLEVRLQSIDEEGPIRAAGQDLLQDR
jgi:hypothetical protein